MGDKTGIEWADATWNPVVGCSKATMPGPAGKPVLRQGCRNCYAIRVARRMGESFKQPKYAGLTVLANQRPEWTGEVRLIEGALEAPLHWRRPRRIFVNSESDLFHEKLTEEQIDQVMAVIAACPEHTFQVLTKRPERMLEYFQRFERFGGAEHAAERIGSAGEDTSDEWWAIVGNSITLAAPGGVGWPMRNLWLGVSVEDQASADYAIPLLLQTPARVRWISAEPLLKAVSLRRWLDVVPPGKPRIFPLAHTAKLATPLLDWVVVGGESGPGARPMHPGWARSLRDQCVEAGVPFFFKQWGEWAPSGEHVSSAAKHTHLTPDGETFDDLTICKLVGAGARACVGMVRVGKKCAGRLLDGREWNEYPEARA